MIKFIVIAFIVGVIFGYIVSCFLFMGKISSYEEKIQKLKKKAIRFGIERDDD